MAEQKKVRFVIERQDGPTEKPYTQESGWGVTAAYTYTKARGNRGSDEHYAFDGETIDDYPFIYLHAVPRHRLVLTGIYDLPWGITASAKATIASPLTRVKRRPSPSMPAWISSYQATRSTRRASTAPLNATW